MTLRMLFFLGLLGFLVCGNNVAVAVTLPAAGICGTDCIFARYVKLGPSGFGVFENNITVLLAYDNNAINTNPCNEADACYNAPAVCTPNADASGEIYNCTCNSGYTVDLQQYYNFTCSDIDECSNSSLNNCHQNATCTNSDGTFSCNCSAGFTGNGTSCTDIDHCLTNTCGTNAFCLDGLLNHTCLCNTGFQGDPYTMCNDTDECLASACGYNSTCNNTVGSFTCACIVGFESPDNKNCTDIDFCVNNTCGGYTTCTDHLLNHTCACNNGFQGDPYVNCTDIDECAAASNCHPNATCTNTAGSFVCTCNPPYSADGTSCTLIRSMQFEIPCVNLTFSADLTNSTSTLFGDVTPALTSDITSFISSVDSMAGVIGIEYVFYNRSTGEAAVTVNATITNGTKLATDFLTVVNTLSLTGSCNGTASSDECATGAATCSATETCADSIEGFCCMSTVVYRATMTGNDTFNVNLANLTHPDSVALSDAIKDKVIERLRTIEVSGCPSAIDVSVDLYFSGSTVAVYQITAQNATYSIFAITDALKNLIGVNIAGLGTVTNSGDFDECASNLTQFNNCSAFATCLNANATYSCDCNQTYYDNSTAAALAGTVCITPVIAECLNASMTISVVKDFYTTNGINASSLRFNDGSCNATTHAVDSVDFLKFTIANFTSCGSVLSDNGTHVLVGNNLTNLPTTGIFTGPQIVIPFACAFLKNINFTSSFKGVVSNINFPSVTTIGSFTLEFGLFDSGFSSQNPATQTYHSQEIIYGQVSVTNPVSGVSVLISKCWGTKSSDPNTDQFIFLQNNCPVSTSIDIKYTSISNGNGNSRFSVQTFFFVDTNELYLHCDVSICVGTCAPTCATGRRRRRQAVEEIDETVTKTLTIVLKREISNEEQDNIERVYEQNLTAIIVGSIIGFVVIVLLAIVVVLVLRKRQAQKFDDYDLTTINAHATGINSKPIM